MKTKPHTLPEYTERKCDPSEAAGLTDKARKRKETMEKKYTEKVKVKDYPLTYVMIDPTWDAERKEAYIASFKKLHGIK